jgi:hypothetical protein
VWAQMGDSHTHESTQRLFCLHSASPLTTTRQVASEMKRALKTIAILTETKKQIWLKETHKSSRGGWPRLFQLKKINTNPALKSHLSLIPRSETPVKIFRLNWDMQVLNSVVDMATALCRDHTPFTRLD